MAVVITAPNTQILSDNKYSIFLAGGIIDCPEWQNDIIEMFKYTDVTLFNPRRKNFPINDPSVSNKQISWEFDFLRYADIILFWFPKETLCPIVLYELGAWSMTVKPIFVGVDPKYKRRQDVEIQTSLVRPDTKITYSLENLSISVKNFINM